MFRDGSTAGWPANIEFHPKVDYVMAVLLSKSRNTICPWPKFCYTPVKLMLCDVRTMQVVSVLDTPTLSPELLSYSHDGKQLNVVTQMKVSFLGSCFFYLISAFESLVYT